MNQYNGYQQGYQGFTPQIDMSQVSSQYNAIMQQMHGQMQSLNERMSQIQNQFQQQYPQLFQQPQSQPQQPNRQEITSCIPVATFDEVKGIKIPQTGEKTLFTNFKNGWICNVFINEDGDKIIDYYVLDNSAIENKPVNTFLTQDDINPLFDYINRLESKIDALQEVNNYDSEPEPIYDNTTANSTGKKPPKSSTVSTATRSSKRDDPESE